jgi:hypothetical protein
MLFSRPAHRIRAFEPAIEPPESREGRGARGGRRRRGGPWSTAVAVLLVGCNPPREPKKIEMEPIGTVKDIPTTPVEEDDNGSDVTRPNSGTPPPGSSTCSSTDFENLEETLKLCEVPMPRSAEVPSIKDKLEVKLTTSTPSTTPGGRIDVQITLRNKTNEALVLYFTGDPAPRFDLEAVDAKGRRVDIPSNKWPGYPKGFKPEVREAKAAKVTLQNNGTAKVKVTWDAVKMRWAPDKAKVWEGRGYPRVPSGPLHPGKYTLRPVIPILGEVETPKLPVEVVSS